MATINEVYGNDFRQEAFSARVGHITDLIAGNFANLTFSLRHDYSPVFRSTGMAQREIDEIVAKAWALNQDILVLPIRKGTAETTMLPYLLNVPAEYFRVVDMPKQKIYLVYVSVDNMEAY